MNKLFEIDNDDKIFEYIYRFDNSEIYHHPCWKNIIKEVFGYKTLCLSSDNAYLPLMYMPLSIFSKKKAISLPIITNAGIAGDTTMLPYFLDFLKDKGFKNSTIKQLFSLFNDEKLQTSYAEYRCELVSEKDIWRGLNKGKKSNVNNAKKKNYKIVITKGMQTNIKKFYNLYLKRMREFGTPPLPKKMFVKLAECFGDKFNMFEIYHAQSLIGATICIGFKDIYYYIYVAFDTALTKQHKNVQVYMIYSMMLEGLKQGYKYFSFGRSTKNSSQAKTKKYMGAKEIDIYYYNFDLQTMIPSIKAIDKNNFTLVIKVWQKLPLIITQILGKYARRFLP